MTKTRQDSLAMLTPIAADLASRLDLKRPLVFFDLETTGTDTANDRIIQVGAVKLEPSGATDLFSITINPGVPIPSGATAVHHITDDDVASMPAFSTIATQLAAFFAGCDLAGFGISHFDIPLLAAEFRRVGYDFSIDDRRVVDASSIFRERERRTLESAMRFYCDQPIQDAHDAVADTITSFAVLHGQFARYQDLPTSLDALDDISRPRRRDPSWFDDDGKLVWNGGRLDLNFGKYSGQPLAHIVDTDTDYIDWVMQQDFTDDVKSAIAFTRAGLAPHRRDVLDPPCLECGSDDVVTIDSGDYQCTSCGLSWPIADPALLAEVQA